MLTLVGFLCYPVAIYGGYAGWPALSILGLGLPVLASLMVAGTSHDIFMSHLRAEDIGKANGMLATRYGLAVVSVGIAFGLGRLFA